jgi:hypothetical protein
MCKVMMPTLMTLTLAVVISSTCLQAQDSGQTSATPPGMTTVQGCVKLAMGRYTLTEEDGTLYYLLGPVGKLGHQVDRQVEVMGKPGSRTFDTTLVGAASSAAVQPVIEVKTVKRTADTCK